MFAPSSVSILSGSSETKKGASSPPRPSIASTMDKGSRAWCCSPSPAPPEAHNPQMKEERSASLRSPLTRRRATRRRPEKARGRGRGAAHAAARRLLVRRAVHVRRVAHVSAQPAGMCDDAPPSPSRALHPSPPPRPSKERSARRARRRRGDCGERVIILSPSLFALRSLVCLFVRSFVRSSPPSARAAVGRATASHARRTRSRCSCGTSCAGAAGRSSSIARRTSTSTSRYSTY